jgi:hypothetical protein
METLTKRGFTRRFSIWGGVKKRGKKLKWGFGCGEGCYFGGGVERPFLGQCAN